MSLNFIKVRNCVIQKAAGLARFSGNGAVWPDGMWFDPYHASNNSKKLKKDCI
jgi:hypothetical protein